MGIITRLVAGVVTVLLGIWGNYLFTPAWNVRSVGMWVFLAVMFIIGAALFWIAEIIEDEGAYFGTGICGGLAALTIVVMIIGAISGAEIFNANKYHELIEVQQSSFTEDIPKATENAEPIIVDVGTARRLGDRTVGSIKNISWYDVDEEYNLIKYQGEYYRISELNYSDFFKFRKAQYEGIPGFVLVNAKTQEAKYVELKEPIRYSPSAHYSYKLDRHLRNQYKSYIFGTSFFEIDEEGNPYYITSVKKPTIGLYEGAKEVAFIITNAATGESKEYTVDKLPKWVDHAYDLSYLMNVIDYNQKYISGWRNAHFSKTGVNTTTYEYGRLAGANYYNTAITADGDIVFYTGVTPANNAESNIGFVLANPRTGKVTYYTCAGAEETSAMTAAESLVQNLGYYATFPTILNVDGTETYFMLLKDKAGLVQRYALCNIKNYAKVVQAEDFETALKLYREEIGTVKAEEPEKVEILAVTGTINNLYEAQLDGCTFYYFTLEGSNNLYMSSIKNSNKQVLLTVGTNVRVEYQTSSEEGVFLVNKIQF